MLNSALKIKKYSYRKIIFSFFLIFLSACTITNRMWSSGYEDNIRSFLVTNNGNKVVFLSNDFHYILDDNSKFLSEILHSKFRYLIYFDMEHSKIVLHENNEIEANLAIKLKTNRPSADIYYYFKRKGFLEDKNRHLFAKAQFHGKRYLAKRHIMKHSRSLNRSYQINVVNVDKKSRATKTALTPITLGLDASLFLGKILLAPLCDTCDLF